MPWLKNITRGYATSQLLDLFGFWFLWRLTGGFEGMQKVMGMSRSSLYRRIALFREAFGEHPDVLEFPGNHHRSGRVPQGNDGRGRRKASLKLLHYTVVVCSLKMWD